MSGDIEVYRLRVGRGNQSGNGSGGDWTLYEDRVKFEEAVLKALIEAAAHGRRRNWSPAARWWQDHIMRGGRKVEHTDWTVSDVYAAEQLIDHEWVDLGAELIPPAIGWIGRPSS